MAIQVKCGCGKLYQVPDEYAGKKTKCKACGASLLIPEAEEEVIVAAVAEEEEEIVAAVVEEDDDRVKRTKGPPKKKGRRRPSDDDGPMARQYMKEARENMRRDEMRASVGRRGDDDDSWTMFGVHVTGGVITGATMLVVGLLCMLLVVLIRSGEDEAIPHPRLFIGAIVWTGIGLLTLVKALFFGEEE